MVFTNNMLTVFRYLDLKSKIVILIILFIGFQQFPVIRAGGSFKLYELLALCLLGISLFQVRTVKENLKFLRYPYLFFVVSPIISFFLALIFLEYPYGFYRQYLETDSFKFNYYIYPILQMIYMFFNYAVFSAILRTKKIYNFLPIIFKYSIYIGTMIALYSLFAMFFFDPISKLPAIIQNKHEYLFRSVGFSQEPSFYILYQTWIVLLVFYSRKFFSHYVWILIFSVNLLSLVFTFSTTLISLVLILFLTLFIFKSSAKKKIFIGAFMVFSLFAILYSLNGSSNWEYFESFFINKITNFFSSPDHTLDSGSFRSYTSRIGIAIFKDYPIAGVGVGNSIYYMYVYENKMGIILFGETLFAGSFPQNAFSIVLSEQGVFGIAFLIALLVKIGSIFWKYRSYDNYCKMFFIGYLFTLSSMISIAPVYSLFIWVFPAVGLGYIFNVVKKYNNLDGKLND